MNPHRLPLLGLLLFALTCFARADGLSAKLEHPQFVEKTPAVLVDFVLTNTSKEPIRIAERWNSWGAYQWTIQVTNSDGSKVEFTNPQMDWTRNFPSVATIEPGRELRTACVLLLRADTWPKRELFVASEPKAHFSLPLKLKGKFSTEPRIQLFEPAPEANWKGTIESEAIELAK